MSVCRYIFEEHIQRQRRDTVWDCLYGKYRFVLFCWELSIGSIESSSGAMYFERFDLLGLTTTEDCAWSRSYELLLLSLTLRFKRPSYRNNGASWENWERYSLNGSRWGM